MQQLWMATDGATLSQSGRKVTSPQTGIDMRSITTSNIESVEVIRGIASAQYGDITSGAVIINNKAGRTPMEIKADINPNVYMASISHGIGLGSKAGVLNYGIDYTFAQQNPREGYDTYNRATGRIAYSNDIGKWQTTTSLNFTYTKDNGEPNPDDQSDTRNFSQRDLGFKFNTKGSFNFNEGWFKNLKYTVSVDYTNKHSFFKDYTSTGTWTYSTSKIDGAVLSSFPGKDLYTADGTKITNIAQADMNGKAWQLPSGYWYSYDLYGKELNTFAQVMTNFAGDIGNTHHRIIVGAEYRTSGNLGRGKVFDPNNPPFRSLSDNFATQRERAYSDVPFMQHIGAFAEETLTVDILRRKLEINAGVRFDKVKGMRAEVAPRLNASYDVIPEHLSIRGGYGVTYKVPSLGFLYPEDAYFDILNFDNSNQSGFSDAQKFQIATTRSFSTKNPNLIMAKATKWEVGADFKIGQIRGSVTYFRDNSNNGYMVGSTLDSYKSVDYIQYSAVKPSNETDMPVLNKNSENKLLLKYQRPTNNYAYTTEGIEFDIDFGRINAIRTAFGINGSWTYNKYWTNSYSFNNHTTGNSNFHDRYPHMGVFEPGNTVDHNNRTATNLRITHNIPRIGFIVTLTANVVWHNRKNTIYGNDSIPIKYISRLDGKVYDVDRERLGEPEFQGIDMREIHSGSRLVLEPSMPPLLCLNINITKEIRNFMRISFFANNMFRSTPILESTSTPGKYTLRNKDLFFFGAALSIKIK